MGVISVESEGLVGSRMAKQAILLMFSLNIGGSHDDRLSKISYSRAHFLK